MISNFIGIVPQRLAAVRIKDPANNESFARANKLFTSRTYVVLGEVANTDHVILLDLRTGNVVPGLMDLAYFEMIPDGEL